MTRILVSFHLGFGGRKRFSGAGVFQVSGITIYLLPWMPFFQWKMGWASKSRTSNFHYLGDLLEKKYGSIPQDINMTCIIVMVNLGLMISCKSLDPPNIREHKPWRSGALMNCKSLSTRLSCISCNKHR